MLTADEDLILILIVALIGALVYFLPTFIAVRRQHRNAVPILLVNLFLGWSFLGWLVALIWSTTDNVHPRDRDRW